MFVLWFNNKLGKEINLKGGDISIKLHFLVSLLFRLMNKLGKKAGNYILV